LEYNIRSVCFVTDGGAGDVDDVAGFRLSSVQIKTYQFM